MTSFYVFFQWARPAWLFIILASAVSVGLMLTLLSVIHGWLSDQLYILEEEEADEAAQGPGQTGAADHAAGAVEIPVYFSTPDRF